MSIFQRKAKVKADPRFAWTVKDNKIGQAEFKLATYLTKLLNERPELSLNALLMSDKVKENVGGILSDLRKEVRATEVNAPTEVIRENGRRRVVVTIETK